MSLFEDDLSIIFHQQVEQKSFDFFLRLKKMQQRENVTPLPSVNPGKITGWSSEMFISVALSKNEVVPIIPAVSRLAAFPDSCAS